MAFHLSAKMFIAVVHFLHLLMFIMADLQNWAYKEKSKKDNNPVKWKYVSDFPKTFRNVT